MPTRKRLDGLLSELVDHESQSVFGKQVVSLTELLTAAFADAEDGGRSAASPHAGRTERRTVSTLKRSLSHQRIKMAPYRRCRQAKPEGQVTRRGRSGLEQETLHPLTGAVRVGGHLWVRDDPRLGISSTARGGRSGHGGFHNMNVT